MADIARFLFALLFGAIAAFLGWATRKAVARRRLWLDNGVLVDGEIVGFEERRRIGTKSDRIPVAPVVSYRTTGSNADVRRFTSAEATYPNPFVLAQRVSVRYMANDPGSAELDAVVRGWWSILVVGTLAAVCLIVALIPIIVTVLE
jgi:Protein of unknown function (DUF3592)